jgi:hypothetical protein
MSLLGFKEWLSKTAPDGAGEIWSNRSNADLSYGHGLRSKRTQMDRDPSKSGQAEIDPEKMYLGKPKKQPIDTHNLGDENGIFTSSTS